MTRVAQIRIPSDLASSREFGSVKYTKPTNPNTRPKLMMRRYLMIEQVFCEQNFLNVDFAMNGFEIFEENNNSKWTDAKMNGNEENLECMTKRY
jgi:hypothetical protein